MWSGKVNPVVEQVTGTLTPGRAFDLGAGEGGDALWLASKGWKTTAVDASSVGIFRGHREEVARHSAEEKVSPVRWIGRPLTRGWPLGTEQADLVTLMFFHARTPKQDSGVSRALEAVAPGGTLLIVGHDPDDAKLGIPRPPEEMCFRTDELEALVPGDWSSVKAEVVTRTQTVNGVDVTVGDVVLVATR
jgi:Tellurite resistance protein TehB.